MRNLYHYCGAIALALISTVTLADPTHAPVSTDITGYWRNIDDVTGFSKGIVHIQRTANGTYFGRIVEIIPRPNYVPMELCNNCPEPFTGQKILGLTAVWNLKSVPSTASSYNGGHVIDPLNGKIYAADVKVSADGRRLTLRGSIIGASLLKRSQTWIREPNYVPKYTWRNTQ